MGHVDAQNPEEAIAFARGHFAQRSEEAAHAIVGFGRAAAIQAVGVLAAENRQNANVRAVDVLQEDHLQFDGVLERVAIVFHDHRRAAVGRQPVDQCGVGGGFAERSHERFARQAEVFGRAVVGSGQDDESAVLQFRAERLIGGAIGLPSAFGAHVRRGDAA